MVRSVSVLRSRIFQLAVLLAFDLGLTASARAQAQIPQPRVGNQPVPAAVPHGYSNDLHGGPGGLIDRNGQSQLEGWRQHPVLSDARVGGCQHAGDVDFQPRPVFQPSRSEFQLRELERSGPIPGVVPERHSEISCTTRMPCM